MKSENAKSELKFWRYTSIIAYVILLLEVVVATLFIGKRVCSASVNWWSVTVLCAIALVVILLSMSICNTIRLNHATCWRIVEQYEYKQKLLDVFKEIKCYCAGVKSQDLINPNAANPALQRPITAQYSDYKLIEMIIERLADDPSKHMFE